MRVFVGFTDVGNIAATYTNAFQALGHETFTAVWSKSRFFPDSQYDLAIFQKAGEGLVLKAVNSAGMFWRMLQLTRALKCDVFVMFAPAVLPTHFFYPVLKRLGKKIVTVFWGSDVRYWYAFQEEVRANHILDQVAPFVEYARERSGGSYFDKLRTIRTAEKYSDLIMSQPDCAQLQERPYMRTHVPLDLSLFKCEIPDREVPLVLHAPSVPTAKGTDHIMAAVEELHAEGMRFDFQLIENMPNTQLRELLTRADIVVDELYALTVGGLSAEAMASGCTVLVRYDAEYSCVPPGCPAVNVNKETLKDHLREVIVNRDLRHRLAAAGRPYVEANNDHIKVAQRILDLLKPGGIREYDFVPTFCKTFVLPSALLEQEHRETWVRRKNFFSLLIHTGGTRRVA